jgi:biopolymer transport protein ExbD/biopolymer transport protein TolR
MKLKKAPPPVSDINVTPMVDVMLVVLIIFMVITPMLNKGANIELPKARNPIPLADADKEDAVKVSITRDGQVFLSPGLERVNAEDLAPKVRDLLQNKTGSERTVYLRADGRAKYGKVEDVVDNLRSGGVDDLGLLTEQDMSAPTKK